MLRERVTAAWNGTRQDALSRSVFCTLLGPAAFLYRCGYEVRRAGYRHGLFRTGHVSRPVVSVGNLTAGGTGKTSLVARFARLFLARDWRVAVISRGYGGRYHGAYAVVSDGQACRLSSAEAGDEPVMLARGLPGLWVVVGRNRRVAAEATIRMAQPDLILLDDGFQSWELDRDLDLVVVDAVAGFGSGRLQPAGPLREPLRALRRAGGIVVTKTDHAGPIAPLIARLQSYHPTVPIWQAWYRVTEVRRFGSQEMVGLDELKGRRVGLVSGIADPRAFRRTVETLGVNVVAEARYPDHYGYRDSDLTVIVSRSRAADLLLTTEKDAVRIDRWGSGPPLYVVRVDLEVDRGVDDHVEAAIRGRAA